MTKMRSCIVLLTISILLSAGCASETDQERVALSYFGQQPPGDVAELFAPGIVSIEGRYEYALSVSPDGREILFGTEAPDVPATLYQSRLEEGGWTPPVRVSLSAGAKKAEMEAFFTPDGKQVYFAAYDEGMDVRIWAVDRGPAGWSLPREMASPLADAPAFFPTTTKSGVIYYSNLEVRRIYCATVEGESVIAVADAGLEIGMHAFIAPDESFVLVDGRLEEAEDSDIYVAFRNEDGSWSEPVPLGPEVNTDYDETCLPVSLHKFVILLRRVIRE
jgi:Tol biopolymer transport system component